MRTVILVWVVAAALALLTAVVVTRPARTSTQGAPVPQRAVLASDILALTVQPAGDACATSLRREASIDAWIAEGAGGCAPAWPADASRVRGAVRLLADVLSAPAQPAPQLDQTAARTRVTVTLAEGDRTLLVGEPLGGRADAFEVVGGDVLVRSIEAGVAQAFAGATASGWSSPALLQPMPGALASLTLTTPGAPSVTLTRARGGWWLGEESASAERVQALLDGALGLRTLASQEAPPENGALDAEPRDALVTISLRFAGPAGTRSGIEQTVTLAPARAGLSRVPARVEAREVVGDAARVLWSRTLFADAGSVGNFRADAADLLSRRASPIPRADVGVLVVMPALRASADTPPTPLQAASLAPADTTAPPAPPTSGVRLALRQGTWTASGAGAASPAAASKAGDAALLLAALLLDRDADRVLPADAPDALTGATNLATVTLASPGGAPLGVVALGTGREGELQVRTRGAVRAYTGEDAVALLAWLGSLTTTPEPTNPAQPPPR